MITQLVLTRSKLQTIRIFPTRFFMNLYFYFEQRNIEGQLSNKYEQRFCLCFNRSKLTKQTSIPLFMHILELYTLIEAYDGNF